jgi:hypothetical protein
LADHLRAAMNVSVIVPEYRSYGIFKHSSDGKKLEPRVEEILNDALDVWNFVTKERKASIAIHPDDTVTMQSHRAVKYQS